MKFSPKVFEESAYIIYHVTKTKISKETFNFVFNYSECITKGRTSIYNRSEEISYLFTKTRKFIDNHAESFRIIEKYFKPSRN